MTYDELLELGQKFHGHKCPAMPLGLRAALAAMDKLGVERATDKQLMALIELDDDHCATCFGDGIQVASGCTFGKGNIKKLHYGKWGVTLIDKKSKRAVRVVAKAETMKKNKESEFMQLRASGVPASQIAYEVVKPLIEMVSSAPQDALFNVSEVFEHDWQDVPNSFESTVCESCGESVVTRNARVKDGKVVCIPCSGYER